MYLFLGFLNPSQTVVTLSLGTVLLSSSIALGQMSLDVILTGGRVMDPETGLDAIRDVGINGQSIVTISQQSLTPMLRPDGSRIDASGLVVAPGFIDLHAHGAHPRSAGTFARVLGHYVRERGSLNLMTALRKMTLMPAQRLESIAPTMKKKGRLQVGADADLVVFDPRTIIDTATYVGGLSYSKGIQHVLVSGTVVVSDGKLIEGKFPGKLVTGRSPD